PVAVVDVERLAPARCCATNPACAALPLEQCRIVSRRKTVPTETPDSRVRLPALQPPQLLVFGVLGDVLSDPAAMVFPLPLRVLWVLLLEHPVVAASVQTT